MTTLDPKRYEEEDILTSEEREAMRTLMIDNIITSSEAIEILGVSRTRLNQYVKDGRITPIIKGVYLKPDIVAFKYEFDRARDNRKWLREFE